MTEQYERAMEQAKKTFAECHLSKVLFVLIFGIAMIGVFLFIVWQLTDAAEQMVAYCNQKYGANNYTIQNGYKCPNSFFHDCYECVPNNPIRSGCQ